MGRSIRNKPKNVGGGSTITNAQLQTKADATTVSALQTTVDEKADATTVSALQTTVDGKADATTVSALQTTVNALSVVSANERNAGEIALAGAGGTKSFTAYSSSILSGYGSRSNLHNNNLNSGGALNEFVHLIKANDTWYYAVEFTEPQTVSKYRIWGRQNGGTHIQLPKAWQLRAATDRATYSEGNSSTYTVLDSQSNQSWPTYSTDGFDVKASDFLVYAKQYQVSSPGAYGYYVIHFTENWSDPTYVTLAEIGLYGLKSELSTLQVGSSTYDIKNFNRRFFRMGGVAGNNDSHNILRTHTTSGNITTAANDDNDRIHVSSNCANSSYPLANFFDPYRYRNGSVFSYHPIPTELLWNNGGNNPNHYAFYDFRFELNDGAQMNLTKVTLYASQYANLQDRYPNTVRVYARNGAPTSNVSSTTTNGFIQPNSNDLSSNWTPVSDLIRRNEVTSLSSTKYHPFNTWDEEHPYGTGDNEGRLGKSFAGEQSPLIHIEITDTTPYDHYRLVVFESSYQASWQFIIGAIDFEGVRTSIPKNGEWMVYKNGWASIKPPFIPIHIQFRDFREMYFTSNNQDVTNRFSLSKLLGRDYKNCLGKMLHVTTSYQQAFHGGSGTDQVGHRTVIKYSDNVYYYGNMVWDQPLYRNDFNYFHGGVSYVHALIWDVNLDMHFFGQALVDLSDDYSRMTTLFDVKIHTH